MCTTELLHYMSGEQSRRNISEFNNWTKTLEYLMLYCPSNPPNHYSIAIILAKKNAPCRDILLKALYTFPKNNVMKS